MTHFRKLENEVIAIVEVEDLGIELIVLIACLMQPFPAISLHQSHAKLCLNPMWRERE